MSDPDLFEKYVPQRDLFPDPTPQPGRILDFPSEARRRLLKMLAEARLRCGLIGQDKPQKGCCRKMVFWSVRRRAKPLELRFEPRSESSRVERGQQLLKRIESVLLPPEQSSAPWLGLGGS